MNETGRIFRSNGYRFADEEEWMVVRDTVTVPISIEVETELSYDRLKSSGTYTESSDMKIEEAELLLAIPMGSRGRVSLRGTIGLEEEIGADGSSHFEPTVGSTFVQINDLAGTKGTGALNLRIGQFEVGFPFLSPLQRVIRNPYLAESTMGILRLHDKAVELNGSVVAPEESMQPTHRYSIGVVREEIGDDDRFKGFYLTYGMTVAEDYSIGVMYRTGKERKDSVDSDYHRYGVAGEAGIEGMVLTLAFFRDTGEGIPSRNNYLMEALYIPVKKISLGARVDTITQKDNDPAITGSFMVRYDILSNVYGLIEYRSIDDDDHLTGTVARGEQVRLYLVALF